MQENQISHCFELNEEDMASSSRAFWKPKNAEEERKLLESATPKSTQAVTKWSLKIREWPKILLTWRNSTRLVIF